LIDNGYISSIRAAAAGALAANYLANQHLQHVAVIGSGNQAYMQLKSLMQVRQVSTVSVWADSPVQADSYARKMIEDHDLDITIAPSIEQAVPAADLIIAATYSQKPLIRATWLKPGVHITAIGTTKQPMKRELYLDVLQRADVIVTDSDSQGKAAGEVHYGLKVGAIPPAKVQGNLGQLITGQIPGRTDPDQITLADLTGLDTQDTVVATLALEKALFLDLGQRVADGATTTPTH
jgi:ornithine cyclodeaminase